MQRRSDLSELTNRHSTLDLPPPPPPSLRRSVLTPDDLHAAVHFSQSEGPITARLLRVFVLGSQTGLGRLCNPPALARLHESRRVAGGGNQSLRSAAEAAAAAADGRTSREPAGREAAETTVGLGRGVGWGASETWGTVDGVGRVGRWGGSDCQLPFGC